MKFITLKKRSIVLVSALTIALILAIVATSLTGSAQVWQGRNPSASAIEHIQTDKNAIALTFDTCELGEGHARQIMQILIDHNARATFFVTGKWAEQNSDLLREMAATGRIEIGTHGTTHQDMRSLREDAIRLSLTTSINIINNITGKQAVSLFRPPYGAYNNRVLQVAASLGLKTIHYTTNSLDNSDRHSQENVILNVMNNANKGAIILMRHDGIHTVSALPPILEALRIRGVGTAAIGELLG